MRRSQSLTVTLPDELMQMVKERVTSGAYLDESEVVREGLRALRARDAAVDHWLSQDVVTTFDRVARGEERLLTAAEVFPGSRPGISDAMNGKRHKDVRAGLVLRDRANRS